MAMTPTTLITPTALMALARVAEVTVVTMAAGAAAPVGGVVACSAVPELWPLLALACW
jgi:hypothetical protein